VFKKQLEKSAYLARLPKLQLIHGGSSTDRRHEAGR
jgi:hypothetical protein